MRVPRQLVPALVLGAGIVAATLTAEALEESGWLVMAGALVLGSAVVGAGALAGRASERAHRSLRSALVIACGFVLVCAVVAWRDPHLMGLTIPLIGGAAIGVLGKPDRCWWRRADAERSA